MSQYGYDFIRNFRRNMAIEDTPPPEINFNPHGYVFAATEHGAETLRENYMLQKEHGVKAQLLGPVELKERFPWLNVDGIELASVGMQGEG
jgi:FAD-dependent oxidoreductase domain-containing protein 1